MKLNETTDMWVVQDPQGYIITSTLDVTHKEAISSFAHFYNKLWADSAARGYRCIPVTVTIKEREV